MSRIILLLFLFYLMVFCFCGKLWGYKDLGNGYYYTENGYHTRIVYNGKSRYTGTGFEIIPLRVIQVKHDEKDIIAVNLDLKTKQKIYWIIEKDKALNMQECKAAPDFDKAIKSNVTGPLDSIQFIVQLEAKRIKLKFNN